MRKTCFFFTKNAKKRPKMKISKIAAWGLERPNLYPFWPVFTFPNLPDSLKYSFLCEKLTFFLRFFLIWDFLYIFNISRKHPSRLRLPKLNRWELRGGWAHFGRRKHRPTTYVKIRKTFGVPYPLKGIKG